jgi:methylmalonyl-CoA mutase
MSSKGATPHTSDELPERLLSMFAAATPAEWQHIAEAELGQAPTSRLTSATPEGLDLRAIYWPSDLPDAAAGAVPGQHPFLRGVRATHPADGAWQICESIPDADRADANQRALAALGRGATALELAPSTPESLRAALAGVDPSAIALFVRGGPEAALPLAQQLATLCDAARLRGALGDDPLALGAAHSDLAPRYAALATLTLWASEHAPQISTIQADASDAHELGASAVEELGYALASAVEQTRALLDRGISIDQIAPRVRFSFAIGTQIFMEIARLRAARVLWAKAAVAFGASPDAARATIHARTARRHMARIDPHVNILRATAAAFAAAVGGADSLDVTPFDAVLRQPDHLSERIAVNIQHLLNEESFLGQVIDPGGGAWYIEALTDSLARRAWAFFQQIEHQGGLAAALQGGLVQAQIAKLAEQRARRLASRRDTMVGVNMYADPSEQIALPPYPPPPLGEGEHRDAALFEALRARAAQLGGPSAFLAAVGSRAEYRARAEFCAGFLAVAGIRMADGGDFETPEAAARAAADSQAAIVVICASDASYPAVVAPLITELRARRQGQAVALAGMPADQVDALRAAGVDQFLHVRADLLATLHALLDQIGGPAAQPASTP